MKKINPLADDYNLAAIDVGTNAARLLIKHVSHDDDGNASLSKLLFLRVPLRLGMDVFNNGEIGADRRHEFIHSMKAFRQLMKAYRVAAYRACATSAMREAKNGKDVLYDIHHRAKIKLEIITGDEESKIIYDNHLQNISSEGNFLYVDVGGGSSEVSFITYGKRIYSNSFSIGTIRLLKGKATTADLTKMREAIEHVTAGYDDIKIIGSGGNINKLHRLGNKIDKQENLSVEMLRRLYDDLSRMSVEERIAAYSLKPDRADVIVPAARIFLNAAKACRCQEVIVPNIGLADGIIDDLLSSIQQS